MSGVVGELHPALIGQLGLRAEQIIVAELAVAGLEQGVPRPVRAEAPPRFPPSERDIAVVVAESTPAAAVEQAIRSAGGDLLHQVRLFDVYRGAPLAPDEKSLAYRLAFQAPDRTLTESEIDSVVAAVVERIAGDVGGRIRA
jgi:phenylalanyl-tRNA synthetase beta chain